MEAPEFQCKDICTLRRIRLGFFRIRLRATAAARDGSSAQRQQRATAAAHHQFYGSLLRELWWPFSDYNVALNYSPEFESIRDVMKTCSVKLGSPQVPSFCHDCNLATRWQHGCFSKNLHAYHGSSALSSVVAIRVGDHDVRIYDCVRFYYKDRVGDRFATDY